MVSGFSYYDDEIQFETQRKNADTLPPPPACPDQS